MYRNTILDSKLATTLTDALNSLPLTNPKYIHSNPDGSTRTSAPTDGELYSIFDSYTGDTYEYKWDATWQNWVNATPPVPLPNMPPYPKDNFDLEQEFKKLLKEPVKAKVCECGSEKVNSNFHSSWCAKYV